jgi:hypothetical protein
VSRSPWSALLVAAVAAAGVASCSSDDGSQAGPSTPARRVPSPPTCFLPAGHSGRPETIEQVVALLDALPKPVTVACFLQTLDRPFHIDTSSGNFSLQPAFGENNPRIFVLSGPLVFSVVPKGEGSAVMEFGLRRDTGQSVRGEIAFPVVETLAPSAPYARIDNGGGTVCRPCHEAESRDPGIDFTEAYASKPIPPAWENRVKPSYLEWVYQHCDPVLEPDRCAVFDAVFGPNDVVYEKIAPLAPSHPALRALLHAQWPTSRE